MSAKDILARRQTSSEVVTGAARHTTWLDTKQHKYTMYKQAITYYDNKHKTGLKNHLLEVLNFALRYTLSQHVLSG